MCILKELFTFSERIYRLQSFVRNIFERFPAQASGLGLVHALQRFRTLDRRVGNDEAVDSTLKRQIIISLDVHEDKLIWTLCAYLALTFPLALSSLTFTIFAFFTWLCPIIDSRYLGLLMKNTTVSKNNEHMSHGLVELERDSWSKGFEFKPWSRGRHFFTFLIQKLYKCIA